MPKGTIQLQEHDSALIHRHLSEGRYGSAGNVVTAGLRILEGQEREDEQKLERLRYEAQKRIDDLNNGRDIVTDSGEGLDAYLATVRERGMALLHEAGGDVRAMNEEA